MKLKLSLSNYYSNSDLKSNLYCFFSQFAQNKQRNQKQKRKASVDKRKKVKKVRRLFKSSKTSENDSENAIVFLTIDHLPSTLLFKLIF